MGYSGNMYAQATEVITSQGDLRRGDSSGNPERLAIGSSGKVLQSNGTTESWETLTTADSVLTTQGDVLYEGASGLARLGQSTDGYVLTTKGAAANPVWAAASAGATLTDNSILGVTDDQSTTSTSDTNMLGTSSATLATIAGGKAYCTLFANTENDTTNSVNYVSLWNGTTSALVGVQRREQVAGAYHTDTCAVVHDLDGITCQMRWHVNQGTATLFNVTSNLANTETAILEIS